MSDASGTPSSIVAIDASSHAVIATVDYCNTSSFDMLTQGSGGGVVGLCGNSLFAQYVLFVNHVTLTTSWGGCGFGTHEFLYLPNGSKSYGLPHLSTYTNVLQTNCVNGPPIGYYQSFLAAAPDSSRVYLMQGGAVHAVDTATDTVIWSLASVAGPIEISPNGSRAYLLGSNLVVVDTVSPAVVATVAVGPGNWAFGLTPDGSYACVVDNTTNVLSAVATSSNSVVATVPVGSGFSSNRKLAFSPNGSRLYVANWGSSDVSVVDCSSWTSLATVPLGGSPYRAHVTPNGSFVYVTNRAYNAYAVHVIDTSSHAVVATIPFSPGIPLSLAFSP